MGALAVVLLLALWVPSLFADRGQLPAVGEQIADFTKVDSDGVRFRLSEAYQDGELILIFYRGYG